MSITGDLYAFTYVPYYYKMCCTHVYIYLLCTITFILIAHIDHKSLPFYYSVNHHGKHSSSNSNEDEK